MAKLHNPEEERYAQKRVERRKRGGCVRGSGRPDWLNTRFGDGEADNSGGDGSYHCPLMHSTKVHQQLSSNDIHVLVVKWYHAGSSWQTGVRFPISTSKSSLRHFSSRLSNFFSRQKHRNNPDPTVSFPSQNPAFTLISKSQVAQPQPRLL